MRCQFCKTKDATVHVTEIADQKVKKVDACAACAKEKNYHDPTAFGIGEGPTQAVNNSPPGWPTSWGARRPHTGS